MHNCLLRRPSLPTSLFVRAGSLSLNNRGLAPGVSRIAIYPSYWRGSAANDIAILLTSGKIQRISLIQYAALSGRVLTEDGTLYNIAGGARQHPEDFRNRH